MHKLQVILDADRREYRPGEQLEGRVTWNLEAGLKRLEINLFYYTKGKGTQDSVVTDRRQVDRPSNHGTEPFSFQLPLGPYSFSGKLISLVWAVEALAEPGGAVERVEFTLSPTGKEIDLLRPQPGIRAT